MVLEDVPTGVGVLGVWAEDESGGLVTEMKTMNVFVYPEINCKFEDGRWWLLEPSEKLKPTMEVSFDPERVLNQKTQKIAQQDGVDPIPGALWKREDGYFIVKGPTSQSAGKSPHAHRSLVPVWLSHRLTCKQKGEG